MIFEHIDGLFMVIFFFVGMKVSKGQGERVLDRRHMGQSFVFSPGWRMFGIRLSLRGILFVFFVRRRDDKSFLLDGLDSGGILRTIDFVGGVQGWRIWFLFVVDDLMDTIGEGEFFEEDELLNILMVYFHWSGLIYDFLFIPYYKEN